MIIPNEARSAELAIYIIVNYNYAVITKTQNTVGFSTISGNWRVQ